jgi:hypothetical protein
VYVPLSVLLVAEWDKRTVSPVSNVTVIRAADVTASLSVAVIFIVEPSLYEPFADEEEKLLSTGLVVSTGSFSPQPIPIQVCNAPFTPLYALTHNLPYMLAEMLAARRSAAVITTDPEDETPVPVLAPIVCPPVNNWKLASLGATL